MAKLILTCPKCKGKLAAPEGRERFRCPACKTVLAAPKSGGDEAVESQTTTMTLAAPVPPSGPAPEPAAPPPEPAAKAPEPAGEPLLPPKAKEGAGTEDRPKAELQPGGRLGGYTIQRLAGRGGMGTVYEAIQEGLKRRVAIKVLPEAAGLNPAFLASLKREAQAVAKLSHPNIVQIYDIDEAGGYHFFSMEYVDGESLGDRLAAKGR
ncbi:MAG: hypothetical protein FJ291_31760, partial [Planctomycetes bacterium]|nr:hypothetical protein [Planctomycetota bacterium]